MATEDIENLVLQAKQRDSEAFGRLYDAYAQKIFRYIVLKVSSKTEAEDVLQEVFIKVWHGLVKFELQDSNFNAWVYRIASNAINDYFRKKYRRPDTVELLEAVDHSTSESLEDNVQKGFEQRNLLGAFEKLPVQYKEILELRFVQDFTIEETAHILGKNSVSARVLQHRALKKLKEVLKHMDMLRESR